MESKAYVLHTRPYRDTSLLVEFFTLEKGRISAVARGAKRQKSNLKGLLQPFTPLIISCSGKHELLTLCTADINDHPHTFHGNYLLSALYLNELLIHVLHRFDPHPKLFYDYENALHNLAQHLPLEQCLRNFELDLLQELGYGMRYDQVSASGKNVHDEAYYLFSIEAGIISLDSETSAPDIIKKSFYGNHLLAIQQRKFCDQEVLVTAKRLLRQALAPLLGNKTIYSRQLFR